MTASSDNSLFRVGNFNFNNKHGFALGLPEFEKK
jgi:hypothetical protein